MLKKEIAVLITFLLLNTSMAHATSTSSYDVRSKDGKLHSYQTAQLQKSLNISENLHKEFAVAINNGGYIEAKDDNGNYIPYNEVVSNLTKDYKDFGTKENVPKDKTWKITFNNEVKKDTMNTTNLKVVDLNGTFVRVKIEPDKSNLKVWTVTPVDKWMGGNCYAMIMNKNITTNLSTHKGMSKDAVIKFHVAEESKKSDKDYVINPYNKEEINAIMKDLSNGIYDPKVKSYSEARREHRAYLRTIDPIEECRTIADYTKILETNKRFKSRYFNEKYNVLTDMNMYMKIPGITVNFDKLNNENKYDEVSDLSFISSGNVPNTLGRIKNQHSVYHYDKDLKYTEFSVWEDLDERMNIVTWRPDIEQEMVDEVNKERKAKGMQPLTINRDLTAMAKYSAKRSNYGFTLNMRPSVQLGLAEGHFRHWVRGSISSVKPYTDYTELNKSNDYDTALANGDLLTRIDGDMDKLFGYKKPVKSISDNNAYFTSATQFIETWKMGNAPYNDDYPTFDMNRDLRCDGKFRDYDQKVNINENLFNPKMKQIGVGSIWTAPQVKVDHNGSLGVFVILSE